MADIAWVRKYRPSSFDDYMGEDVKRLVVNRFADRNNIPNTIMLYGTRGTGKTSMARLLCKEIHCMEPVDGHSCGECEMCQAINEYISSTEAGVECPGIIEVDAATTTGKNDINDIIEDAIIPPMYPLKYKVVIMDECHMLSVSAQNRLLKVIEEPPSHLIFILCTTDPEKVIDTIHSRMQLKLEVKKKSVEEMTDKLLWISEQEGLTVSREALQIIAKKGDRIPRECINLLESVAKTYGNNVTVQNVREAIGDVSTEIYIKFYESANKSLKDIALFNKELKDKDISAKNFVQGLARFTMDCIYIRYGISLDDFPVEFVKVAGKLFSIYKVSELDALLNIVQSAYFSLSSDDVKNELIITNTALRIGKVGLLAKGLAGESADASNENYSSIRKYQEKLEEERKSAIEKMPDADPKKEEFASVFNQMSEIKGGTDIVDSEAANNGVKSIDNGLDPKTQRILDIFENNM